MKEPAWIFGEKRLPWNSLKEYYRQYLTLSRKVIESSLVVEPVLDGFRLIRVLQLDKGHSMKDVSFVLATGNRRRLPFRLAVHFVF